MKTPRFLFTIIAFGSLTLGLCSAAEPPKLPADQYPHKYHATSVRPANRDQTDRDHSLLHENAHTSARSGQAAPIHTQPKSPLGNVLHQPGVKKAGAAANYGLTINRPGIHREQSAKWPVGSGTTAPTSGIVRSRSAGTAVISGVTSSSARKSAAALNGNTIKGRP